MTLPTAKVLYDNLKTFGLTPSQVRKLLPAWWSKEAEREPDGVAELCVLVSRRLSLDLGALLEGKLQRKDKALTLAYKHSASVTADTLQGATSVGLSLAEAVTAAMVGTSYVPPGTTAEFRKRVKARGRGIVGLGAILDTCWESGIPVVPMTTLPVGMRKMDGAVINCNGRPVIIVSKKKSSRAWLSFIIAHEIGHIACGHLTESSSIVDVSLQEQVTYEAESSSDKQEREADAFALELMGGKAVNDEIASWASYLSPVEIAVRAREAQNEVQTESGHLVLRYAFETKRWPESMTAMNFLSEDSDGEGAMRRAFEQNLDLDNVADDLQDLIEQVTGISRADESA